MAVGVGGYSHVHLIPHLEGLDQRREIGRGSFGAVYEVKMNGLPCIAKGLHDILLGRGGNLAIMEAEKEAIRAKFRDECALLGNLKHPNIVQFLGVHQSKDNDEWLMMEYLHMDLAKCLEMNPDIPLPLKLSILRDVSYGLLHLHSQAPPIIHRDLTAPNILLTLGMSAKIADLGVSKIFDIRQLQRSAHTTAPGTLAYMPPEALSPDPKYDAKLDVFSYGALTLYVANQAFPIVHEPPIPPLVTKKQEIQIYKRKHWVDKMGVAHPLYSVVMQCLLDSPDHRPTSKELNDIITKLCAQHKDSCKNILELYKELQVSKMKVEESSSQLSMAQKQIASCLQDNTKYKQQADQLRSMYGTVDDRTSDELKRVKAENAQLKQKLQEAEQKCKEAERRRDEYCLIAESSKKDMVVAEQILKKEMEEKIQSKERLLLETLARKPERNVPLEWFKRTLERGYSRGVLADPSEATVWKAVEAYYEKRRMREQGSTEDCIKRSTELSSTQNQLDHQREKSAGLDPTHRGSSSGGQACTQCEEESTLAVMNSRLTKLTASATNELYHCHDTHIPEKQIGTQAGKEVLLAWDQVAPEPTETLPQPATPIAPRVVSYLDRDATRFLPQTLPTWQPTAPTAPVTPMDRLIAIGFADRELNNKLLSKHGNNINAVVNELLDGSVYET